MFKLIKWGVGTVLVVAIVGTVTLGRDAGSYLSTAVHSLREEVQDTIPVEVQLDHAEQLVREIEPELNQARRQLAQAHVDLEHARERQVGLEFEVEHQERSLRRVAETADADAASYSERGTTLQSTRLARTFDRYRANKRELEQQAVLIARQQAAVEAAQMQVEAVREQKAELEQLITELRIQKRQNDALAASAQRIEIDPSALSRARETCERIKNRLEVNRRLLEEDLDLPTIDTEHRDIEGEVRAYFDGEQSGGVVLHGR
ncbi:MAG: hypothetical protein AAF196_16655 [Planctomycetota bacterium]